MRRSSFIVLLFAAPFLVGAVAASEPGLGHDAPVDARTLSLDLKKKIWKQWQRAREASSLEDRKGAGGRVAAKLRVGSAAPIPVRARIDPGAFAALLRRGSDIDALPLELRFEDAAIFGARDLELRTLDGLDPARTLWLERELRRDGLLAPRTRVLPLEVRGKSAGWRLARERIGKLMLEAQQRRDGPILKRVGATGASLPDGSEWRALSRKHERASDLLASQYELARGLLRGFARGDFRAHEIFDVDSLARSLAWAEYAAAPQWLEASGLRLYLNPVTLRFEPVLAVELPEFQRTSAAVLTTSKWAALCLSDPVVASATQEQIARLRGAHASRLERARALGAELARHGLSTADATARLEAAMTARASSLPAVRAVRAERGAAKAEPASAGASARLPVPARVPLAPPSLQVALSRHAFLRHEEQTRPGWLRVTPGAHFVKGDLALPDGYGLEIGPGTTLRFAQDAALIAYGPLRFVGEAEAPIVLEGAAGVSGFATWPGVVSLRARAEPHLWRHVVVRGTRGIGRDAWRLTGGVTLRDAAVRMEDARFIDNFAEDALNLIRSRFELVDISVVHTPSDAVDADFSHGWFRGGRFEDIGGDGIDVSGARVEVEGMKLYDIRDKAISVGEGSLATLRSLDVRRVGIAVASKDGSQTVMTASRVEAAASAGLMAYIKKPEYGAASLAATGVEFVDVPRRAAVQRGSELRIDGALQATEDIDVETLYSSGRMKK